MLHSEETFLCLKAGESRYLVPLMDLDCVSSEIPADFPHIYLGNEATSCCFVRLLNDGHGFALGADEAELVQIPSACQYEMPKEALGTQNTFLSGVSYWEKENTLCFLLDSQQLWTLLQTGGNRA